MSANDYKRKINYKLIDGKIVDRIRQINDLDFVETIFCCQGHFCKRPFAASCITTKKKARIFFACRTRAVASTLRVVAVRRRIVLQAIRVGVASQSSRLLQGIWKIPVLRHGKKRRIGLHKRAYRAW